MAWMRTFRSVIETLLDTVMPRKARDARTRMRTLSDISLEPVAHELLGERITTVLQYRDDATQDLIRSLKYDGSRHAAALAAQALADYLREELANVKALSAREILLVPVPLHRARKRERGYNQIELVLKALPSDFRDGTLSRLAPEALARTRATEPQTKLRRSERLKNVVGAFSAQNEGAVRDAHIFLIDDVTTTGATLVNAAAPLQKSGARVTLLALARA